MPITFESIQDPFGIRGAGSILAQALTQQGLERRQERALIGQEGRQEQALIGKEQRAEQRALGSEQRQREMSLQKGTALADAISSFQGQITGETLPLIIQEALRKGAEPKDVLNIAELLQKPELIRQQQAGKQQPQSIFQKKMEGHVADLVFQAPKVYAMGENINRARELAKSLSGLTGYGKAALNTEEAAELSALGLTMVEPVLKIFNPVGAIPTQKIELVRQKYAMNAWDRADTIEGKARALERIQQAAIKKIEHIESLVEKYGDVSSIPQSEWFKFNQQSEKEIDDLLKKQINVGANINVGTQFEKMPSAKDHEGDEIQDENGVKYISDGTRWKKVK
jgi:hypothetical protein